MTAKTATHRRVGDHAACNSLIEANLVDERPSCRHCLRILALQAQRKNRQAIPFGLEVEQATLALGDEVVDEDEYFLLRNDGGLGARGAARLLGRQLREVQRR